jgi:hypothetical protein
MLCYLHVYSTFIGFFLLFEQILWFAQIPLEKGAGACLTPTFKGTDFIQEICQPKVKKSNLTRDFQKLLLLRGEDFIFFLCKIKGTITKIK